MSYKWKKALICSVISLVFAGVMTRFLAERRERGAQEQLAQEVFRFHVIANSNSEEDQALKMKVKEQVIAYMEQELPESQSANETLEWAISNINAIEEVARATLSEEGSFERVSCSVANVYFPDKTYGDITFPKGNYNALRIEIGEAQGENWWCVLYPNLCFLDAVHAVVPEEGKEELRTVLDEDVYEMVTAFSEFRIRWFFF